MSALEGEISYEVLNKKFERTNILFDDSIEETNDYFKNSLKYTGPDPNFLASDAPRNRFQSENKVNSRVIGSRYKSDPYAPDLFLGFTDKDPRGTNVETNIQGLTKSAWKRKDDYKFSFKNDASYNIPSKGMSETEAIKNQKAGFYNTKNRMKNFETAFTGWTNGYNQIKTKSSDVSKVGSVNLREMDVRFVRNKDYTSLLSNLTPIGWKSTVDHRFKIARYNPQISKQKLLKDIDFVKNRYGTISGKKDIREYNNMIVSKALIVLIDNIKRNKKTNHLASLSEIVFKKSKSNENKKSKKNEDKQKILDNVEITHKEIKKIDENINKKSKFNKKKSAINEVIQTHKINSKSNDIIIDSQKSISNQVIKGLFKSFQEKNKSNYDIKTKNSIESSNIKSIDKEKFNNVNLFKEGIDNKTFNKYNTDKQVLEYKKGQINPGKIQPGNFNNDLTFKTERIYNKPGIGKYIGKKYTNNLIENDIEQNDINDSTQFTYKSKKINKFKNKK